MSEKFTVEVPIQYRDLDPMNHVNNAVYANYMEEARLAYAEEVLDFDGWEYPFVVAGLEIDYRQPLTIDDDLSIATALTELGTTSFTMSYEFRVEGSIVASAETTLVHIDTETRTPAPIPESLVDRIRAATELDGADK